MTYSERRKMERFSLELPAKLMWSFKDRKHESLELMTSNICAGGAFFKTQKPLSMGTDVKVNLILHLDKIQKRGSKRSIIDVSGSVIRTDNKGMAICFDKRYKILPLNR